MIHLSLCTISFRHHLISLPEIACWARDSGFQGIELWGAHARNLINQPELNASWVAQYDLDISMLSDYLTLDKPQKNALEQCLSLCDLAQRWGTTKVRTFAGAKSSRSTNKEDYEHLVSRLRFYCSIFAEHGIDLLIETHPNTFADTSDSTLQLIESVDAENLKINFDVLHIWESGECTINAWHKLLPFIRHMHLKNISDRLHLNVFEPSNIYAAAGSREGIVPTFDGAFDYNNFFKEIPNVCEASLEWFGGDMKNVLLHDRNEYVRKLSTFSKSKIHTY